MSCDSKYIFQLEGPFGETEIQDFIDTVKENVPSFDCREIGYGTLYAETKWSHDEKIADLSSKQGCVISVVTNDDHHLRWKNIFNHEK